VDVDVDVDAVGGVVVASMCDWKGSWKGQARRRDWLAMAQAL